jgi:uncharacterized protein YcsI (UPF0317 family)
MYPGAHGAPIFVGMESAREWGIQDIGAPDYGDAVSLREGEVPVFWACGVTPQTALMEAKLPIAITHSPGYMFVTDILTSEMQELRPSTGDTTARVDPPVP